MTAGVDIGVCYTELVTNFSRKKDPKSKWETIAQMGVDHHHGNF